MRVAFIQFSANRDGSAFSGLILADGFAKAGHEVRIFFAAERPMVRIYQNHGHEVEVVLHQNWLRNDGLLRTLRNRQRERANAATMARRIEASGADLVYVNTGASYAGALAAKRLGLPCIWHLRELFSDVGGELRCPRFLRSLHGRDIRRLATRLVANSRAVADNVLGGMQGVDVIPNAVEDRFFQLISQQDRSKARDHYGFLSRHVVIGIPGTLRPMKGHSFALKALAPLAEELSQLHILVSGSTDVPFATEVLTMAKTLPYAVRIHFVGDQSDMWTFFAACDLICVPSSSESFGRTVIEAMACRLPVVATRVGGIPEIIDDGVNGLLVDYGDEEGLREAVERLLNDEALCERLGMAGREKAVREFSEEVHAERIIRVADEVMTATC
jgi:glycosyltransferase involved in cell wall biosynthesis